jgi:hypothetical protein
VTLGNRVLYANRDQVWVTDGTAAGTVQLADLPCLDCNGVAFLGKLGNLELFAQQEVSGASLWRTDGTRGGTIKLAGVGLGGLAGKGDAALRLVMRYGLWSGAGEGRGPAVLRLPRKRRRQPRLALGDRRHGGGHGAGRRCLRGQLRRLQPARPGAASSSYPVSLVAAGSHLFFLIGGLYGLQDSALWWSDWTDAGTQPVPGALPSPAPARNPISASTASSFGRPTVPPRAPAWSTTWRRERPGRRQPA